MKKITIAVFGGLAMASALASGYFYSVGVSERGLLFAVIAGILLLLLFVRLRSLRTPAEKAAIAFEHPAMNLAFYGELSRLIDEGKDINGYLRECGAPKNVVKSVNIGGSSTWYYHKDDMPFDEFSAGFPIGETPSVSHPCVKDQRTEDRGNEVVHIITVDLYRALWDWGEQHPEKHRYTNSMRIAFHGACDPSRKTAATPTSTKASTTSALPARQIKRNPKSKRNPVRRNRFSKKRSPLGLRFCYLYLQKSLP